MEERKKRTIVGYEPRKSEMNHTFFGGQELKKKTTLGERRNDFEGVPRVPEMQAKPEAVNASSEAALHSTVMPNDRHERGSIMKTFKEEVDKLLDF